MMAVIIDIFNGLFVSHLLIAVGVIFITVLKPWGRISHQNWSLGYKTVILGVLVIPLLMTLVPEKNYFAPPIKINGGEHRIDYVKSPEGRGHINITLPLPGFIKPESPRSLQFMCALFFALTLAGLLAQLFRVFWGRRRLYQIWVHSYLIRRIGKVRVFASDDIHIPFSVWYKMKAMVFIPTSLVPQTQASDISILHELQHHRQGDTIWVYLVEILRGFFFMNPFVHFFAKHVHSIQELACDEALVGRKGLTPQVYGRCLLQVAETGKGIGNHLVGTASMSVSPSFLKRRIEMTLKNSKRDFTFSRQILCVVLLLLMGITAFGGRKIIDDKRISFEKARALAKATSEQSDIPIVITKDVLKWLNLGVASERGRLYFRQTFRRMKQYEDMIDSYLRQYKLPMALKAVPLLESGYQNYDNGIASGIWSFTPGTARHYGLRVDDNVDERRDPEKLTVAAMKYYTHLRDIFSNWHFSLMAYNLGESRLLQAIRETGEQDPFKLIKTDTPLVKQETRDYLPKMMAAIIVLYNPELVEE